MARPPDPSRKQELLERAVDYLATHGLAHLTLRPLAEALGVTPHALAHHFGSKEELIEAVTTYVEGRQIQLIGSALAEGWGGLRRYWDWLMTDNHLGQAHISIEASMLRYRDDRSRPLDLISDWIALFTSILETRGAPRGAAEAIATRIHADLLGLVIDVARTGDVDRCSKTLDYVIAQLETGEDTRTWQPRSAAFYIGSDSQ